MAKLSDIRATTIPRAAIEGMFCRDPDMLRVPEAQVAAHPAESLAGAPKAQVRSKRK